MDDNDNNEYRYDRGDNLINSSAQSIVLQRCQSRIKQLKFDLDVSNEVSTSLKSQLRDANQLVQDLKGVLKGNGTIQLGEKGLKELLVISQNKLRKSEKDAAYTNERVQAMSKDLRKCRLRVQECELERALHLEKIDECLTMLSAQAGDDNKQTELQEKVLKLCELRRDVASYNKKIDDRDTQIREMKATEKISSAMVQELTRLLSPELNAKQIDETIAALQKGKDLSTEQAQLLTIQHLKSQVEKLEDEKSTFVHRITYLTEELETASMVDIIIPTEKKEEKPQKFFDFVRSVSGNIKTSMDDNNNVLKKYAASTSKTWKK